jgi:hypothetical protein
MDACASCGAAQGLTAKLETRPASSVRLVTLDLPDLSSSLGGLG